MMPGGAQLDDAGMGERIMKEALKETLTKLRNLSAWSAGWNGYDSLAPNSEKRHMGVVGDDLTPM